MNSLIQDVRFALRSLAKSPGFAATVILTLALGIGANSSIFTIVNGLLLNKLPVKDPNGLVLLGEGKHCCQNTGPQTKIVDLYSYALYKQIRDHDPAFTGLAAFETRTSELRVRRLDLANSTAVPGRGKLVSANYFSVLGVDLFAGRAFTPEEEVGTNAHPVAVLSYTYWAKTFDRDRSVLGKTIQVNGLPFNIIGVAPRNFFGEGIGIDPPEMYFPLSMQPRIAMGNSLLEADDTFWLYVMGRLAPGVEKSKEEAQLALQAQRYMLDHPGGPLSDEERNAIPHARLPLTPAARGLSNLRDRYSEPLWILMAVVALVLLITCANIANLFLARASSREREIVTRLALGATRARLVQQLLTESVLMGLFGGLLGTVLAFWGTQALFAISFRKGAEVPLSSVPDARVLGFTFLISFVSGVVFGLAPVWRFSHVDIAASFQQRGSKSSWFSRRFSLGKILVVAQVALCLVLVVGAGLFSKSLSQLQNQEFGFDDNVLDVKIDPQISGYEPRQLPGLYQSVTERVHAVPGVASASFAFYSPFSGNNWMSSIIVEGFQRKGMNHNSARWTRVGESFFETVGMPVMRGRGISPQDTGSSTRIAVISEKMVNEFFEGKDPIGMHFAFEGTPEERFEVVGVVKDAKYNFADEDVRATFYLPLLQSSFEAKPTRSNHDSSFAHDLLVRASGNPSNVIHAVRAAILSVDPNISVGDAFTLKERVDSTLVQEQLITKLSSCFGMLSLVIASVGLYGLMSYTVQRRTREIGIRMALGARHNHVLGMVLSESMQLVVLGIVVGLPIMFAAIKMVSHQFFGIAPYDPATIFTAVVLLVFVATMAGYMPARSATRVDPIIALRSE